MAYSVLTMASTMDDYIEQLLAEMADEKSTLHDVVQNILDEPIPDSVKGRLLKPLYPEKYRPPRPSPTWKDRKRKAIEEEFDPMSKILEIRGGVPG